VVATPKNCGCGLSWSLVKGCQFGRLNGNGLECHCPNECSHCLTAPRLPTRPDIYTPLPVVFPGPPKVATTRNRRSENSTAKEKKKRTPQKRRPYVNPWPTRAQVESKKKADRAAAKRQHLSYHAAHFAAAISETLTKIKVAGSRIERIKKDYQRNIRK